MFLSKTAWINLCQLFWSFNYKTLVLRSALYKIRPLIISFKILVILKKSVSNFKMAVNKFQENFLNSGFCLPTHKVAMYNSTFHGKQREILNVKITFLVVIGDAISCHCRISLYYSIKLNLLAMWLLIWNLKNSFFCIFPYINGNQRTETSN